ncbi:MAG: DUF1365 domain-containing protein [Pseudomonadota bacterium]
MTDQGVYVGKVMHRRLRPAPHRLEYRVFSMLVDVESLPAISQKLRLFSHNRFNLFSIHDRDHGDGDNLQAHLTSVARQAIGPRRIDRFLMLCYPRVLGYVFNPLTVYYGLDANGETVVTIYEVNNTFGERHTYALKAEAGKDGLIRQDCQKVFHVSPFNRVTGSYAFRTRLPDTTANVGILLNDEAGPLIAAHFSGTHQPLRDRTLAAMFCAHGPMTLKVWAAIRYEAVKLLAKRVPFYKKPPAPNSLVTTGTDCHRDLAA